MKLTNAQGVVIFEINPTTWSIDREGGATTVLEKTSRKGQPDGYAGLDGNRQVPVENLPGLPAAPHASTHQNGASDEINVAGLSGVLADPQTPASHSHAAGDLPDLDGITAPNASVNFNGQQATNFRIENRTSDPSSPAEGQIWLRTDL